MTIVNFFCKGHLGVSLVYIRNENLAGRIGPHVSMKERMSIRRGGNIEPRVLKDGEVKAKVL